MGVVDTRVGVLDHQTIFALRVRRDLAVVKVVRATPRAPHLSFEALVALGQGLRSLRGADDGVDELPRWPQRRAVLIALFGG